MSVEFDIGPLTWVKDEIIQALGQVKDNLTSVEANPHDVSALKYSETHLFQVSGALDMVGLEGCKRFCSEIAGLTHKLEKQLLHVTPEILGALRQAINVLEHYLQDLLNGEPDRPLRLYPSLKLLATVQGGESDESELFFPDTSVRAPKDIPNKKLQDGEYPAYYSDQRNLFQRSLVSWFKQKSDESVDGMRTALEKVLEVQQQPSLKTLWWAATAYVDTLSQEAIAENSRVKRLCRRIDQQLKILSEGTARASEALLREILYYVAVSKPTTSLITRVKQVFELDDWLRTQQSAVQVPTDLMDSERSIVDRLIEHVGLMKDMLVNVPEHHPEALSEFKNKTSEIIEPAHRLTNQSIDDLLQEILHFVTHSNELGLRLSEEALIEVASALNILEDSLRDYNQFGAETIERFRVQTNRLHRLLEPNVSHVPPEEYGLGRDVLQALAQQIRSALKSTEETLDKYFRNPTESELPGLAIKPLTEVAAAFDMLSMDLPAAIAKSGIDLVQSFQNHASKPGQPQFEILAEGLSMLGLLLDDIPHVHPDSQNLLESLFNRMRTEVEALGIVSGPDEIAEAAVLAEPQQESEPERTGEEQIEESLPDRAHDSYMLEVYLSESVEVLKTIAHHLRELTTSPTDYGSLIEIRRGFHTLKGSGRMVGLTNLGEVAWAVEKLLNSFMDRKIHVNTEVLSFVDKATEAFSEWIDKLKKHSVVDLDPKPWQLEAESLMNESISSVSANASEDVVIGGTHHLSKALFNIFINESAHHMHALTQAAEELSTSLILKPSETSKRAAHTLASNAGTAGFHSISELSRALENWLDVHQGVWTEELINLYKDVVIALGQMLRKAFQFRQPRQSNNLLNALIEATASLNALKDTETNVSPVSIAKDKLDIPVFLARNKYKRRKNPIPKRRLKQMPIDSESESPASIENNVTSEATVATPKSEAKEDRVMRSNQSIEIEQELYSMFVDDANELVPTVGRLLRLWRANPSQIEHSDEIQRALHTLKGSARMAWQNELADTVHSMEDRVIRSLRNKSKGIDFEGMFLDLDRIGSLVEYGAGLRTSDRPDDQVQPAVLRKKRRDERAGQLLRLRAEVLDRLINEAGEISISRSRMEREMLAFKQYSLDLTESVIRLRNQLREMEIEAESQLQSRMATLQEANEKFDPLEFDRFTRLQELTRMMAESVNDVSTIQHGLLVNLNETESALSQQNRMNRELQYALMNVRMVPFSIITERLQRIVRQTSRELEKHVELDIVGESVEMDRSVLDKIVAPLEHLLRNAVSHGIETPEERRLANKDDTGNVKVTISRENDEILIVITDDGAGIDLKKVRQKAILNGLFDEDQQLSEQALMSIIFEPGFTTATTVTQISGRGVGLDSVRSDITGLGGRIDVDNSQGQGAVFSIYLPVTLSVAQVVMIRSGGYTFAVPAVMVEQVQKLKPSVLMESYESKRIAWSDREYPIYYLGKLLGNELQVPDSQLYTPVMLLRSGAYRIALHVDEILGNQEVVMKPIGPQLARVPGIIGASVLGDGKVIFMLNAVQLANREVLAAGVLKVTNIASPVIKNATPLVMIVDDSLTMRKVLARLLEREGYMVVTAKDGLDALQVLEEVMPDILFTDIEMPRMDGFELIRNLRDQERFKTMPVAIISSRTAEKHQALAKELGVDAYLGKPVQDEDLIGRIEELTGKKSPASLNE